VRWVSIVMKYEMWPNTVFSLLSGCERLLHVVVRVYGDASLPLACRGNYRDRGKARFHGMIAMRGIFFPGLCSSFPTSPRSNNSQLTLNLLSTSYNNSSIIVNRQHD
jgi:hypothetical protein